MKTLENRLLAHHRKDLSLSGLTDPTIADAAIRSASKKEIESCLNMKLSGTDGGMIIPYFDLRGNPLMETIRERGGHPFQRSFVRVKPDWIPGTLWNGKSPPKYLSPAGSINHLYIPPAALELLRLHATPIHITEGEKKTLALLQAGFCSIGIAGVYGWRTRGDAYSQGTGSLLPEFGQIPIRRRKVYLVYDSDTAGNRAIQKALRRFAIALCKMEAFVVPVIVPSLEEVAV